MSNILAKKQKSSPDMKGNKDQSTSLYGDDYIPRMIIDEKQKIIFCNQPFKDLCGDIEGNNIDNIFSSEKEINIGENSLTLKTNKQKLSFQIDWVPSQSGERFMVGSIEDTSDKGNLSSYVTEKVMKKRGEEAAPFIDLSFDACSITDSKGNFITINQNFTSLFGYSLEELTEKNIFDLVHPNDQKKLKDNIKLFKENKTEGYLTIETYSIDKAGKTLWIEWKHSFVGEKLYSTGRDLTPLKFYRESLQRQQKKLTEAEAIGNIGQWEWEVGGDKIKFSDQLYAIFGVEKGKFNPTLDSITRMIDRRDSGRMIQVFQRAVIEQNDYDMDFRLTRPDGELRYVRCEGRCETDQDDDVIALYGIMQDITDATHRELDLVKAKESVEHAYAAKTQFLANMSHELRTPLNAIIGFSEMIERQLLGPIGTEKYLEYIGGIRESGEHLLDLISDILDMSKIEAGKYELNIEKFNIAKVIGMAAHMMEGRALDAEIKINVNLDDEMLQIAADRRAVMQMVLNLLSNAVKFSHTKGNIDLSLVKKERHISIIIKDEGIGIPANKLANITMPFEQAESDYTREYEGSGLGLAITKELAEMHGGNLHIESTIDVGTTVTIRLPIQKSR